MWLSLPPVFSPSAPVMAESTSALDSLCRALAQSVTWKGKLRRPESWRRVLRTAPWTMRLFGRICEPSTGARGVASWISSLRVIRANRSALPANVKVKKILATCGRTSRASSASVSPSGSSSKTWPGISNWDFDKSPGNYDAWAIAARRDSLQRRKSARRIDGSACLLWPTSRAEDAESCGNHPGSNDSLSGVIRNWHTPTGEDNKTDGPKSLARYGTPAMKTRDQRLRVQVRAWKTPHGMGGTDRHGKTAGGGGEFAKQAMSWRTPDASRSGGNKTPAVVTASGTMLSLKTQAIHWQTPAADSFRSRGGERKDEAGLDQQARRWFTPDWPTPTANDYKSGVTGEIARPNARPLREIACQSSVLGLTTRKGGAPSSAAGRRLNPLFVECLMGLPLGWTGYEPLEMASFRSWLLSHSTAYARYSNPTDELALRFAA